MINSQIVGQTVKNLRKKRMMTLQQLSAESGISTGYLSKIERGTVNPSVKNIQKLCFVLGITANELITDQTEGGNAPKRDGSFVLRKEERKLIYGVTNALEFETIYEGHPSFKLNVLSLAGGLKEQSYSVHTYDELGIVAKGKLGITLDDDQQYELCEGECIMISANTKHFITNLSQEECVSYWIETYNG